MIKVESINDCGAYAPIERELKDFLDYIQKEKHYKVLDVARKPINTVRHCPFYYIVVYDTLEDETKTYKVESEE